MLGRLETCSRKRNNFAIALSQNVQQRVHITHRKKSNASMNGEKSEVCKAKTTKMRKKDELIFHILEMSRRVSHNKKLPPTTPVIASGGTCVRRLEGGAEDSEDECNEKWHKDLAERRGWLRLKNI